MTKVNFCLCGAVAKTPRVRPTNCLRCDRIYKLNRAIRRSKKRRARKWQELYGDHHGG
jgi:hypothetical protein